MFGLPPVTQALLLTNVITFFAAGMGMPLPFNELALWPLGADFKPWQVLTYGFLHSGLSHLAFNMFGLYMFGSDIERVWGSRRFLNYYLICVISAAIAQLAVSFLFGSGSPTVGASGGIFGLLIAFAMLYPNRMIMPLIPPIPMRAPVFVALYGGLELFLGVTGTQAGVAHFAHLGDAKPSRAKPRFKSRLSSRPIYSFAAGLAIRCSQKGVRRIGKRADEPHLLSDQTALSAPGSIDEAIFTAIFHPGYIWKRPSGAGLQMALRPRQGKNGLRVGANSSARAGVPAGA